MTVNPPPGLRPQQTLVLGPAQLAAVLAAARAEGYARAVANLRDRARYGAWAEAGIRRWVGGDRSETRGYPDGHHAPRFADYLEEQERS
jgi:hypothetical protein